MIKTSNILHKFIFIITVLITYNANAQCSNQCNLQEAFHTEEVNGQKRYLVKPDPINKCIHYVEIHAKNYPPSFNSKEERTCVESVLNKLLHTLKILTQVDKHYELPYAHCLAMGHNLDFKGTGEEANRIFQNILSKDPENAKVNYLYGMFLSQTHLNNEAFPFLHKARDNGIKEANFGLSSLYLSQNKMPEAIKYLEEYLKYYPHPEYEKFLKALKSNDVKIQHKHNGEILNGELIIKNKNGTYTKEKLTPTTH